MPVNNGCLTVWYDMAKSSLKYVAGQGFGLLDPPLSEE